MRWADLDILNHVNNVVYLDYAAESRAALVDDGVLDGSAGISDMTVVFRRPLALSSAPVLVESTIDAGTLTQRICGDRDDERVVWAEVVTGFGEPTSAAVRDDVDALPMRVRRSDLDGAGEVVPTKVFELFQECRVLSVARQLGAMRPGSFVVGTSRVAFHAPVRWSPEPLRAHAWISRVGRGSFEMRSDLTDGVTAFASSTTTLVGFDPGTQRSRPFADDERAQLTSLLKV